MLVPIETVRIGKRVRSMRESAVAELVESIAQIGLQVPITVVKGIEKRPGNSDVVAFDLVAGRHRLEACKRLGLVEIEATVVQMDENQRELWEIDENLCRADLSELERGEHLARRKALYEDMHPETRRSGNVGPQRQFVATDAASFSEDTSDKVGVDQRTIQRSIRRVVKIDKKVRDRIRDNPEIANSGVELDALAQMDAPQQRKAVALVESGQAAGIRDAKKIMEPKPVKVAPHFKDAEVARQKRRDAFVKAWNALDEEDRKWARGHIDEPPVADNTSALRAVS